MIDHALQFDLNKFRPFPTHGSQGIVQKLVTFSEVHIGFFPLTFM